ncbi:UNVERIFIED_CONTAM: hypothetical protein GTU68_026394 [Idotea baltica]|nr:hypothetical protein [Idotea baltica]
MYNNLKILNLSEELVNIRRNSRTVKGGRIISFSVLTVVGNKNGKIGFGLGKSRNVSSAIKKALNNSIKNITQIAMPNNTIWCPIVSSYGSSKIFMKPAKQGTGIVAGSSMRLIFKVLGISGIRSKIYGSKNPLNVVRATFLGLKQSTRFYFKRNSCYLNLK